MKDNYNDEFKNWLNKNNDDENITPDISEEKKFSEYSGKENNENHSKNDFEFSNTIDNRKYKDNIFFNRERNREKFEYVDKNYVDEQIKKSKPKFGFIKASALVLAGSIIGSFMGPYTMGYFNKKNKTISENVQTVNISKKSGINVENAVAKKAIPSVVGINTKFEGKRSIFGEALKGEGIGSGVIVSQNGYILTNAHVVQNNPKEINVIFSNDDHAKAKVVWKDETLDLCIIKVDKKGLPAVEFGNSDELNIGDKAIAIGNPVGLNLQSTLTSGYISGLNRSITMENGLIMNGLIQTDASINSGNSGGALLNDRGQLIGINTAKVGSTDGIGFAIPVNIAKSVVESVIKNGNFSPILLGIRGIDLKNYIQYTSDYDLDVKEGVYVAEVMPDSTASDAGIKAGDVILSINGKKIGSMNALKQALLKYKIGDKVKVTVLRDSRKIDLNIIFKGEKPNA